MILFSRCAFMCACVRVCLLVCRLTLYVCMCISTGPNAIIISTAIYAHGWVYARFKCVHHVYHVCECMCVIHLKCGWFN